ncbi:hypothetical protein [Schlesneria sp.]|uniref:hypothetical protein n=1 Tax=Schlesneria sp. TaxID=2762018 RepID=UPI002EEE2D00
MSRHFASFLVVFTRLVFAPLISTAGAVVLIIGSTQAHEPPERISLKEQSTEDLICGLDSAPSPLWLSLDDPTPYYEEVLKELIARGGSRVEQALRAKLRTSAEVPQLARKQLQAMKSDDEGRRKQAAIVHNLEHNLERLTALRRVQHRADPLQIIVTIPPTVKAGTRCLPILEVALKNQDVEKIPVWIKHTNGCARWAIHVWDDDGKMLPIRHGAALNLGTTWFGPLEFGDTSETKLSMSDYVDIQVPGEYKVQVLYHDQIDIGQVEDVLLLERLIVLKSEPFVVRVEHGPKITIELQPVSMQQARDLIRKLDGNQKLRMVVGKYTDNFHKFLDPKSAQGELLTMSWQAVPALLESLEDEKRSFRERAWLLALLYSITEERGFDPRMVVGILPNYEYQEVAGSGWQGSFEQSSFDQKRVDSQREFSRRWLRFRDDYIIIKLPNGTN